MNAVCEVVNSVIVYLWSLAIIIVTVDNVCIEVMSLHITRSTLERCHNNLNTLTQAVEELITIANSSYHGYHIIIAGQSSTRLNSYNQSIVILWKGW